MQGEEQVKKGEQVWKGALLLSIAAIIAKLFSAAYRIPYQNIAGDIGFYVYQQIYPFYGLMVTLAMYGFPVVLSRQIAQYDAKQDQEKINIFVSISFYSLLLFSLCMTIGLFFSAPALAQFIGDPLLEVPLKVISFTFLLIPFLSIGRGVQQGLQFMLPTAVSQVVEQFIRVCSILLVASLFIQVGYGPYGAGTGAAIGSLFGGVAAIVVLGYYFKKMNQHKRPHMTKIPMASFIKQSFQFFSRSIFICVSALIFILFQFIDVFSVVRLLFSYGMEQQVAYYEKSLYDRGQPLLQLGTIVTTTFTLAFVPFLSKAKAENNQQQMHTYRDFILRLTFLIAGAASIGLYVLIEPINSMLFTDRAGSDVLKVMSFAIFASALYMTSAAILQGYGQTHLPVVAVVIGLCSKLCGNFIFIPMLGTIGAALATVCAFLAMAVMMLYLIKKHDGQIVENQRAYRAIILTFLVLFGTTKGWIYGCSFFIEPTRAGDTLLALSTASIGIIVVIVCCLVLPVCSDEEWALIPGVNKIKKLIGKKGR